MLRQKARNQEKRIPIHIVRCFSGFLEKQKGAISCSRLAYRAELDHLVSVLEGNERDARFHCGHATPRKFQVGAVKVDLCGVPARWSLYAINLGSPMAAWRSAGPDNNNISLAEIGQFFPIDVKLHV